MVQDTEVMLLCLDHGDGLHLVVQYQVIMDGDGDHYIKE